MQPPKVECLARTDRHSDVAVDVQVAPQVCLGKAMGRGCPQQPS
jgi:hypothetical protein